MVQHRSERAGIAGQDELRTQEQRIELGAALQVLEPLQISLRVPLVRRQVEHTNLAQNRVFHLGDLELRARYFAYQDREFAPRHLIALQAGLRIPTAPQANAANGERLVLEAQTGTGSFDPIVGVSYGFFMQPWSLFASLTALLPTPSRFDARAGYALLGTVSAQFQPLDWLGLSLALDTRFDTALIDRGEVDPHSGGFIAFASPGVILKPIEDLIFQASVRIPFVQALRGEHTESVMVVAGVVYDL